MGTQKKERNRLVRQGKSGTGMDNIKIKGENFYRYVLSPCRIVLSWSLLDAYGVSSSMFNAILANMCLV